MENPNICLAGRRSWLCYLGKCKKSAYSQVHLQWGWNKGGAVLPEGAQRGSGGQSPPKASPLPRESPAPIFYLSRRTETNSSQKIKDGCSVTREERAGQGLLTKSSLGSGILLFTVGYQPLPQNLSQRKCTLPFVESTEE